MLQFLAVISGFYFLFKQINLLREKNMLDTLLNIDALWKSNTLCKNRKMACEKYLENTKNINLEESVVLGFFEDIGLYVKRKVFGLDVVWEKYSYYIDHYWDMYEPHIQAYREGTSDDTWFHSFEYLKSKMDQFSQQRGIIVTKKTIEEINKFRGEEQKLI